MTVKHHGEAMDILDFENGTQRYIFLELAARADRKGVVRMPQSEVAQVTLLSPATVKRAFRQLEAMGLLSRMGHGRYEIVLNGQPSIRAAEGAEAELERLKATKRPEQGIAFRADGWPVIVDG